MLVFFYFFFSCSCVAPRPCTILVIWREISTSGAVGAHVTVWRVGLWDLMNSHLILHLCSIRPLPMSWAVCRHIQITSPFPRSRKRLNQSKVLASEQEHHTQLNSSAPGTPVGLLVEMHKQPSRSATGQAACMGGFPLCLGAPQEVVSGLPLLNQEDLQKSNL